jgi:hypothetical protein
MEEVSPLSSSYKPSIDRPNTYGQVTTQRADLLETVGHSKDSLKRDVYRQEHPYQKIREISNKQSDDSPKTQENRNNPTPKVADRNCK